MAGRSECPVRLEPYENRLVAMVESGRWGYAHTAFVRLADRQGVCMLPLGNLARVTKVFVYLNRDARLLVNGCFFNMSAQRAGAWEFMADMNVSILGIADPDGDAIGKYCVFGDR